MDLRLECQPQYTVEHTYQVHCIGSKLTCTIHNSVERVTNRHLT